MIDPFVASQSPVSIPVTVIGGYLGAGKTTFVNHLLRHRANKRLAILVNDFGDISIDADLIESAENNVLKLAGGCICCSFGSDLMQALVELASTLPRPDHVLIETSGIALPGSVGKTLQLVPGLVLDAVVVLADVSTLRIRAADQYVGDTVMQQLQDAHLVILNKLDLAEPGTHERVVAWLCDLWPSVRVLSASWAQVASDLVIGMASRAEASAQANGFWESPAWRKAAPLQAEALFESFSFEFSGLVDTAKLLACLADSNPGLLRAKGVMQGLDGRQYVLHQVGSRGEVSEFAQGQITTGRLVAIGAKGHLDQQRLSQCLRQAGARLMNLEEQG